ncbi:hypothetical protein CLI70_06420 [Prevotella intermedia]|nr:hypothetical protein CLI70_06420 [Prevotella intermedia]
MLKTSINRFLANPAIGFISSIDRTVLKENHLRFVKIIPKKNGNFDLALRKWLFCAAKQPLLPCKTYAFATQNNRFCKVLIHSWLCKMFTYKISLHIFACFFLNSRIANVLYGYLFSFARCSLYGVYSVLLY